MRMKIYLSSPLETEYLAISFAYLMKKGVAIALRGDLGVGKSSFARALIRALAHNPDLEVPSPSFALVQPYETMKGILYHYDLWRLENPENIYELGWDDACEEMMLVEWAEHAGDFMPSHTITLSFFFIDGEEEGRSVVFDNLAEEQYRQISRLFHKNKV